MRWGWIEMYDAMCRCHGEYRIFDFDWTFTGHISEDRIATKRPMNEQHLYPEVEAWSFHRIFTDQIRGQLDCGLMMYNGDLTMMKKVFPLSSIQHSILSSNIEKIHLLSGITQISFPLVWFDSINLWASWIWSQLNTFSIWTMNDLSLNFSNAWSTKWLRSLPW